MTDAPASASRAGAPFAFLGPDHPMASRIARVRWQPHLERRLLWHRRRLLWHRAAAEVHHVAVALKKDRHESSRAQRILRIAQHCAER